MVFKRRDKGSFLVETARLLWPQGGWARAFHYVKHRLRRLPDSPERIARGVAAGVFTTFTPFYGLHFVIAVLIARVINGNYLASLMATFFGNPLTYVPIGVISLQTGHFILGTDFENGSGRSFGGKFADAGADLWHNFKSIFTDEMADWHGLAIFYDEVFLPYLVGGIAPGIITATVCYFLSVPVIRAYQKRRSGKIKAKLEALKMSAAAQAKTTAKAEPK